MQDRARQEAISPAVAKEHISADRPNRPGPGKPRSDISERLRESHGIVWIFPNASGKLTEPFGFSGTLRK